MLRHNKSFPIFLLIVLTVIGVAISVDTLVSKAVTLNDPPKLIENSFEGYDWVWCGPPEGSCPIDEPPSSYSTCPPTESGSLAFGYYCLNGDYNQRSVPIPVPTCCTCTRICPENSFDCFECVRGYGYPGWPPPPPPIIYMPVIER